jgi:hypothetical protein
MRFSESGVGQAHPHSRLLGRKQRYLGPEACMGINVICPGSSAHALTKALYKDTLHQPDCSPSPPPSSSTLTSDPTGTPTYFLCLFFVFVNLPSFPFEIHLAEHSLRIEICNLGRRRADPWLSFAKRCQIIALDLWTCGFFL